MTIIELWPHEFECGMCGVTGQLNHAVGWYEGPIKQDPGDRFTLPNGELVEAGGMPVCRCCHDQFYSEAE